VAQLTGGRVDPGNYPLRAPGQQNPSAPSVVRAVCAGNPAFAFQPMQQRHDSRLLDTQPFRDLCLRQCLVGEREMQEGTPLGLAQTHGPKAFVQLQSPDPRCAMQKLTKRFFVGHGQFKNG
jgi:hypothetical protein